MEAKMNREEKQIVKSYEKGEFKPVASAVRKRHLEALKNARGKDTSMTIRINSNDLLSLKKRAEKEGLPYQTLVTSVLHKFIAGNFIDAQEAAKIKKLIAA